ncbi:hypothetical protein KDA_19730 [Dictyobacter alpinus]|uniref:Uncharacterized protein n=1 Tax=Dictyobacter alpinus TaxID=2014873 RepID=A0A402B567_9CHLR|nr:hypothetical protein KDA_19730 [Dictyobacter alpinus]
MFLLEFAKSRVYSYSDPHLYSILWTYITRVGLKVYAQIYETTEGVIPIVLLVTIRIG